MTPGRTPLEGAYAPALGGSGVLKDRSALEELQETRRRALVRRAAHASPFYALRLRGKEDLPQEELPFTLPSDLAGREGAFLTVSQSEVARIVTLATSGSTGPPKSICFTGADLAATREFFRVGLTTFTPPGSRVAVLFAGERSGSVGALLRDAVAAGGGIAEVLGTGEDPRQSAARLDAFRPHVVVGIPEELLRVARAARHVPDAVLASGDMLPPALRRRIADRWPGELYAHYGLTEAGWGVALECDAHEGAHLREWDLLTEIVSPEGYPVAHGQWGEVVLTTLTRPTFPLIRYRTGDEGRLLPGVCPCGSLLRRLEVRGRLGTAEAPGLYDAAEILWSVPELEDFRVGFGESFRNVVLELTPQVGDAIPEDRLRRALGALGSPWGDVVLRTVSGPSPVLRRPKRGWERLSG